MLELTIRKLKRSGFSKLYEKLMLGSELTDREKIKLLTISVVLINQSDKNLRNLGYRVVLSYGNLTSDYKPLFDLSINLGLIPVSAAIEELREDSFFSNFTGSYIDTFSENGIISTEQQYILKKYFSEDKSKDLSVVAPTSYGKSDLIIQLIGQIVGLNICVVVPSKSLVSQTKKRIIDAGFEWLGRVITHPEMYRSSDKGFVSVLTQERLSRLLHDNSDLKFDYVFIDEAHNLFGRDGRSELLASVLSIIKKRNSNSCFKFLTPFLVDPENLKLRYSDFDIDSFIVSEYVKSERMYLSDFRKGKNEHYLYDQFFNEFYKYESPHGSLLDLIFNKSSDKNIVYFNKPKNIEKFSLDFIERLDSVDCDVIRRASESIEDYVDVDYTLLKCLDKGVVYHHGSIPENIKSYIEDVFRKSDKIKYIVTSSTLLEGVNLPAERLFVLENTKGQGNLSPSQFKNLVGRIARFSEVFSQDRSNRIKLLEPSVYVVGSDEYSRSGADLTGFLTNTMKVDKKQSDNLENTLLENTDINARNEGKLESAKQRLENLENNTVPDYEGAYAKTDIGKILFVNNIVEIDIFKYELDIQEILDEIKSKEIISDVDMLVEVISYCFIAFSEDSSLVRLEKEAAKNFYKMFLTWMVENHSFSRMVASVVAYWNGVSNPIVYVGKWGEFPIEGSFSPHWLDIREKNEVQRLNLAIVRVKEEEDFIDYKIFRFVDVLNDYGMLDENFYLQLKYGTTDDVRVSLIKEGFSRPLSKLISENYSEYVSIDEAGNLAVSHDLLPIMQANKVNDMLTHEASMNIKA
jgi:hypothetical protein